MYFFTSDEHLGHNRVREYSNRPFSSIEEMDDEIIKRNNEIVKDDDIVVHGGDFSLIRNRGIVHKKYVSRLKGKHIFIVGSHDYWLDRSHHEIWEKRIEDSYVVVCHYAMRVWPRSHYGSWQLYGHSHGRLEPIGKQLDIGVDNNNFYPFSFEEIEEIMIERPDNPNLIKDQLSGKKEK